jgi:hypothetical protein
MSTIRISHVFMGIAIALYLMGAVAWAGVAPATDVAPPDLSGLAAIIYDPNTWVFIGWESIFIIAGLTVRALVIRLTE